MLAFEYLGLVLMSGVTAQSSTPLYTSQQVAPVIPAPTGPCRVGTAIFHLVDTTRGDFVTKMPGQFNEMMIQVWYPADVSGPATPAPYVPDLRLLHEMIRQNFERQSSELLKSLARVKTHSVLDAPLVNRQSHFPLLIASPGIGSPRFTLTSLVQDLASHGYIVVCIDHPYCFTLLPDGRVQTMDQVRGFADDDAANARITEERARDASFVLTSITDTQHAMLGRFARHIDHARVGIFGHSTGGAVALEASRRDPRFRAAIDLDGVPFGRVIVDGFRCPTAVFASHMVYLDEELAKRGRTRQQMRAMGEKRRALWTPVFKRATHATFWVEIAGTNHVHFSDYPFIMPDLITQFGGQIIDQNRGFSVITTYMREFFDRFLKCGASGKLLDVKSELYPEVSVTKIP
jgi:hypothetical protein